MSRSIEHLTGAGNSGVELVKLEGIGKGLF
jgi:hypothetical protein